MSCMDKSPTGLAAVKADTMPVLLEFDANSSNVEQQLPSGVSNTPPPVGVLKVTSCAATMEVRIVSFGRASTIMPGHLLNDGEHTTHKCSDINATYSGDIILLCEHGIIKPDLTQCRVAPPDDAECERAEFELEHTFTEAYIEISRLVTEYQ